MDPDQLVSVPGLFWPWSPHLDVHVSALLDQLPQLAQGVIVGEMVGIGENPSRGQGAGEGQQKLAESDGEGGQDQVEVDAEKGAGEQAGQVGHDQGAPVAALGQEGAEPETVDHQVVEHTGGGHLVESFGGGRV